jgi:Zn-dependent peptidase ImmA (M78 family)
MLAQEFRRKINLKGPFLDIIGLLDLLPSLFPGKNITYDVIDDITWDRYLNKNAHASYNLEKKVIYIRESIFERACQGKGRDRFTIAHEIAHAMLLEKAKINFNRSSSNKIPSYKDPEWQANCLAGELLIPYERCKNMSVDEIVKNCGVSYQAARYQKNHF